MIRRTITLPDALAAEIDAAVAAGGARNVSRFLQDAARRHLDARRDASLEEQARRLDPDEEIAIARGAPADRGQSPWGRLG